MYLGNGAGSPYTTLPKYTDADFAAALRQVHSISVAIHQLQADYERTKDKRFLDSIQSLVPQYQTWMTKANEIAAYLKNEEMPSAFMLELSNLSDWLSDRGRDIGNVVKGLTNPFVLLGIGALALFIVAGRKS